HVARKDRIEIGKQLRTTVLGGQLAFLRLADLVAYLAVQMIPDIRFEAELHRDFMRLAWKVWKPARRMPQLDVTAPALPRNRRRGINQGLIRAGIVADHAAVVEE